MGPETIVSKQDFHATHPFEMCFLCQVDLNGNFLKPSMSTFNIKILQPLNIKIIKILFYKFCFYLIYERLLIFKELYISRLFVFHIRVPDGSEGTWGGFHERF